MLFVQQAPLNWQVRPVPQVPQLPPHPSGPQMIVVPLHVGWQHLFTLHTVGKKHEPQVPPQPSLPQALPVQSGLQ